MKSYRPMGLLGAAVLVLLLGLPAAAATPHAPAHVPHGAPFALLLCALGAIFATVDAGEVKAAIEEMKGLWKKFQDTNEERVKQMLTRGSVDALIEEKLGRFNAEIERLQGDITKMSRLPQQRYDDRGGKVLTADEAAHAKAFMPWLRKGRGSDELRQLEQKAMNATTDPDGGYLVPVDTSGRMVTRFYETSPLRQYADVATISGGALEGPTDRDEADCDWVSEEGTRSETDTPQVGMWRIEPHEIYAKPKTTQRLLDDAAYDVEGWLTRKVTERMGRKENTAFITGNGVGKPRGLFSYTTAATADSSRAWKIMEHVKSGANGAFAASDPADKLFDLTGALKAGYRQGASWVTNRAVVTAIRKLKDGNGQYIWAPGLQAGQPQSILGYPVVEMEDVPALATDSLSLGFGNLRIAYQIVDVAGTRVLRDPYSSKPYVEFYTTRRVGGDVLDFEAFKFMKFSA